MPSYVSLRLRLKRAALLSVVFLIIFSVHRLRIRDALSNESIAASGNEDLTIYELPESTVVQPAHLTPVDPTTLIELGTESIDVAHRKGILHTGAVLYVMDASGKILVMKRSPSVVTCPNTWSIVGEHSIAGEDPNNVPIRALEEELGLSVSAYDVQIQNMTEFPLYYIRHYGARNGNRIDRQLTYMWLVVLPQPQEEISWKLDHEVADAKWITLNAFDEWLKDDEKNDNSINSSSEKDDGPPNGDFCHRTIRSLLKLGIERLEELL